MMSRVLARSLQASTRAQPARFTLASSATWTRSMANHNRSVQGANRQTKPSKPDQNVPSSVSAVSGKSQKPQPSVKEFSKRQDDFDTKALPGHNSLPEFKHTHLESSKSESRDRDYSAKQEEFDTESSPSQNTVPISEQTNSKSSKPGKLGSDYSEEQNEFGTSAIPSENTAPQSTSSYAIDPAEAKTQNKVSDQPLPDLTQGIPSTLEYELSGAGRQAGGLNLTEAEGEREPFGGGRGKGELPASAYISSTEKKRLRLANYMYGFFALIMATGTIYLGRNWDDEDDEIRHREAPSGWSLGLMWKRSKARLADQLNHYTEPAFRKLLPDPDPAFERPYTLVLGMEDVLLHSEWTREHGWRMAKRPGLDYFLRYLTQYYELVIWTPQPMAIADPIVRKLDPYHIITWPLYREATLYENGEYVKDLSYLNRDLSKVILLDSKASHASHQPENAIVLPPWTGDPKDTTLVSLIPFLEYIHTMTYSDVRKVLSSFSGHNIPTEFARREAIARAKFNIQLEEEKAKRPRRSGVGALGNMLGIKPNAMMVMSDPAEMTPGEAFAQGKMLQDQARERGQRNYEMLQKEIRENGEKWLKEEAANEKKMQEEVMKGMKSGFMGWFGGAEGGEQKKEVK